MIDYIEQAIRLLWGDYAFNTYPTIFEPLLNIMLLIFGIIVILCSIKIFKWLFYGWWH